MRNSRQCLSLWTACVATAAMALVFSVQVRAQVQYNGGATIDFTGFTAAGFAPAPAAGQLDSDEWAVSGLSEGDLLFGGTGTTGDYARGTSIGGVGTGGVYAFDIGGNTALGVQPGGTDWTPGTFDLAVQNATGATLTSVGVSYTAYYLNDQARGNSFNFSYSTDGQNYTPVPALDLTSPELADGSPAWVPNFQSTTILGISVPDMGIFYLRWSGDDATGSGSRDEFALDDIVLGGGGAPTGACFSVDFSTCTVTTSDDCTNMGGIYNGDGTMCPPPTGACCEGMVCSNGITEADCQSVGGSYRGDDTDCSTPGICELGAGACCVTGVCQIANNPSDCCTLGGVYLGEGSTCDMDICGQLVSISTAKAAAVGTPITLDNVILTSATDLVSSANNANFMVQDTSGPGGEARGLTVFGTTSEIEAILAVASEGSVISLTGLRSEYNGLAEIDTITGYQVCSSTSVPAPVDITAADLQDGSATAEDLESVLVKLSCVEFANAGANFAAGSNYTVTDPNTNLTAVVRVSTATLDLVGQPIPTGGVAVTGILSQFDFSAPYDSGYQLLIRSISDLEACGTAVGACYTNGGLSCVVTTESDCTSMSGTYQGDGTACPAATGACCENDGLFCTDNVSQFDCEALGGLYRGDDSMCSTPNVCDIGAGACCVGGACQVANTPAECCSLGGVYMGEGTTCDAGLCDTLDTVAEARAEAPGTEIFLASVVIGEPTDLVSSANSKNFTVQDMSGPGGAPRGITVFGTNAEIDPILAAAGPGSILSIRGDISDYNGLAELTNISLWDVCGSTSAPTPVTITALDLQDGNPTAEGVESVLVTLTCVSFNDAGGTFAAGTNYTVTDAYNGVTATVRIQTADLDLVGSTIPSGPVTITGVVGQFDSTIPVDGGYQLQPVSISAFGTCGDPYGACVLPSTDCITTTAADCSSQSGTYLGDGAFCPAPTGACCTGASCADGVTQTDCETGGGIYQGDDTDCGSVVCFVGMGACCLGDGSCQIVADGDACCTLGGVFLGDGTDCTAGNCDVVATLDEARAAANGTMLTLGNVIVTETTDLVSSSNFKSFTVQDMSGTGGDDRGLTIFGANADIDAILAQAPMGSILSLSGTTTTFNGLLEFGGALTVNQVCGTTALPAPVAITTADLQDSSPTAEAYESVRVTLSCVTFNDAGMTFASGTNYTVTDSGLSQTAIVRVATADLDLVGQTIPSGPVAITGVLSQFDSSDPRDGGYQLLVARLADIEACTVAEGACCVASAVGSCPTCAGDMNGDNVIDMGDVADFVNALLGQPLNNAGAEDCANTDLDGNGDVNGLDAQSFVGLLTSGATCDPTCSVVTESECTTLGGTFLGTGTTCDGDPCNG